jgi:hypothetical protein
MASLRPHKPSREAQLRTEYFSAHQFLVVVDRWRRTVRVVLFGSAYIIASRILFDGWLKPIVILTSWRDRVAFEYWSTPLLIGLLIGATTARLAARTPLALAAPAIFIAASMTTTVALTARSVEKERDKVIAQFQPDRLEKNSFWQTLREAPADFQFFLHAAAMKQCVPYAWSYRQMNFYKLNEYTAPNVIPAKWLEECRTTGSAGR